MEGLTPASADDLPPLGELLVDDPFWQYPAWGRAREGAGLSLPKTSFSLVKRRAGIRG
jgi:hypothetical protein